MTAKSIFDSNLFILMTVRRINRKIFHNIWRCINNTYRSYISPHPAWNSHKVSGTVWNWAHTDLAQAVTVWPKYNILAKLADWLLSFFLWIFPCSNFFITLIQYLLWNTKLPVQACTIKWCIHRVRLALPSKFFWIFVVINVTK